MSNAVWAGAYYGGLAVVIAASVGFGNAGGWIAAVGVIAGYWWVLRRSLRAIDDWYERADK